MIKCLQLVFASCDCHRRTSTARRCVRVLLIDVCWRRCTSSWCTISRARFQTRLTSQAASANYPTMRISASRFSHPPCLTAPLFSTPTQRTRAQTTISTTLMLSSNLSWAWGTMLLEEDFWATHPRPFRLTGGETQRDSLSLRCLWPESYLKLVDHVRNPLQTGPGRR